MLKAKGTYDKLGLSSDLFKKISDEVLEDVSTRSEVSKKIFLSFKDSMSRLKKWSNKSEQAYMKARG